MLARIIFFVLMTMVLTGCVTGQKQRKQTQQIRDYERVEKTYYEDISASETAARYLKSSPQSSENKYLAPVRLTATQIQKALKNAGYYKGPIDGIIGPKTKSAILKFQNAHGLKADGIVGKNTSAKLNEYLYR